MVGLTDRIVDGRRSVGAKRYDLNSFAIRQNLPVGRLVLAKQNEGNAVTDNLGLHKD